MKLLTFLFLAAIASSSWAGDIYRWMDENGVIRYSDQTPPTNTENVQKLRVPRGLPADQSQVALPPETVAAAQKMPVTLYSFKECDACKNAEDLLNRRGIPYHLKNTNDDKIAMQKLTGKLKAPVMVIGSNAPIIGFEENRWHEELDLAGYARSNPNAKPGTSMAIKPPASDNEIPAEEALPVTLYSFEECGAPCKSAVDLLEKRGVPYQLKNTSADKIALQKLTGKLKAPVMVIGSNAPVEGFEEERWNKQLDLAGYARSNPDTGPGVSGK